MITSWKDFFIAVEQMRVCQKEYFKSRAPAALALARKCETAVDACINEKRAEWVREKQTELWEEKMGRRTKSLGIVLKNLDDADRTLQKLCEIESQLETIDNSADEEIATIKESAAAEGKPLREQHKAHVQALESYAAYSREEIFRERKSLDRPFGTFGYRKAPDSIHVTKETAVLLKKQGLDKFLRVKIEPDKEAMLSLSDDELALVKANRRSREDFFIETKREQVNQELAKQGA